MGLAFSCLSIWACDYAFSAVESMTCTKFHCGM